MRSLTQRYFPFNAFLAFALLGAWTQTFAGAIVTREIESKTLDRKWSYNVYLPTGYENSNAKYPVFYLLHGMTHNFKSWANDGHIQTTVDTLIANGEIPPAIVVMPDGGTSWYVDLKEPMERAFLNDLIPDVEKQFKAQTTREGRLIGGLSMGGYGSLHFALKYPELFAAAALLSPAIYDPEPPASSTVRRVGVFGNPDFSTEIWKASNYPTLWEAYLAKKAPVPLYIVSGDDDVFYTETAAMQLYELLRKNKQPGELRIVDGGHTWPVWASTIGDAMKYIFRYVAKPAASTR